MIQNNRLKILRVVIGLNQSPQGNQAAAISGRDECGYPLGAVAGSG